MTVETAERGNGQGERSSAWQDVVFSGGETVSIDGLALEQLIDLTTNAPAAGKTERGTA
ncbi:hypothetical protein [Pacificoceanicola onchidii]|uniref:hypothetical protein n=1 Tax=Pacificoceanicola onchidii TaxID=2562685 RepID=UPI001455DC2E|nr:hypothetical protein [Pacificoceanicola onchidii]